jgi:hypothetical protein
MRTKKKKAKLGGDGRGPVTPSGKFWTLRREPMEFFVVADNIAMSQIVVKNLGPDIVGLYAGRSKALAPIDVAGRQPHPCAVWGWDHRRRLPFASAFISADTVEASTDPEIRIRLPLGNSISMTPAFPGEVGEFATGSGVTATGLNTAGICARSQSCWRQRKSWLAWIPAARATSEATAPLSIAAATIHSFSVCDQRRDAAPT